MFSLTPPTDPLAYPAWLVWLDANHLTPLACRILANEPLPMDVRAHLDAGYTESRAAWLQRRHETSQVLAILAEEPPISVVLLKGMALAVTLYADAALRPMNDIDFMVHLNDIPRLFQRMRSHGFDDKGHSHRSEFDTTKKYQLTFTNQKTHAPLNIEFHARFTHLSLLDEDNVMAWFWSQTDCVTAYDHPTQVLNPSASLLYACAHATQQHGAARAILIWFYDIDLFWRERGNEIQWEALLEQARLCRWEAALCAALLRSQLYFQTPLPAIVHSWLQQDPSQLSGYQSVQRLARGDITRTQGMTEALRFMSLTRLWPFLGSLLHLGTVSDEN
ncbi:MAG: nucleotidyltransferase family protein [Chloroflexi bacterium]|nr:nucleotidyltransferase family protein [Chloroflexota bacterium]